jgi:adenine-specific DNA-methyltransferase
MNDGAIPARWSRRFGLARTPMFERGDAIVHGDHQVLLDGGSGSFGLSVVDERSDPAAVASWAWSSDLPHHVTVNHAEVQVVRWDAPAAQQLYSLESVNRDLDGFYRYLCRDRLQSNRTVVQHLVNLFGRIRSLVAHSSLPDERAIDAFVTVLADLITQDASTATQASSGCPMIPQSSVRGSPARRLTKRCAKSEPRQRLFRRSRCTRTLRSGTQAANSSRKRISI